MGVVWILFIGRPWCVPSCSIFLCGQIPKCPSLDFFFELWFSCFILLCVGVIFWDIVLLCDGYSSAWMVWWYSVCVVISHPLIILPSSFSCALFVLSFCLFSLYPFDSLPFYLLPIFLSPRLSLDDKSFWYISMIISTINHPATHFHISHPR